LDNQTMVSSSSKGIGVEKVVSSITERMKSWFKEL
jgi:hypothetical protein